MSPNLADLGKKNDPSRTISELRIVRIVRYHIDHWVKTNPRKTREDAIETFSKETKIPTDEVARIDNGGLPTTWQTMAMKDAFGWSICFVFNIMEETYCNAEMVFFDELGISTPGFEDRHQFSIIITDLKLEILKDQAGGQGIA